MFNLPSLFNQRIEKESSFHLSDEIKGNDRMTMSLFYKALMKYGIWQWSLMDMNIRKEKDNQTSDASQLKYIWTYERNT